MLLNKLYLAYSYPLLKEIEQSKKDPVQFQRKWFDYLIKCGRQTSFGREHGFDSIKTVRDFQCRVPVRDYNGSEPYFKRMLAGEESVMWNKKVRMFAKSSGTSAQKSKFIPISAESLRVTHYGGFQRMLSSYINRFPKSGIFKGKALTLGGSVTPDKTGEIFTGDLSALLLKNSPAIVEFIRTPKREIAMMADFEEKLKGICSQSIYENVTNFSGVPSWNLMLLNKVLEYSGRRNICEVWPNMELFMHGGIGFEPYRAIFNKLIPSPNMHYLENYNASEGYFAFQDDLDIDAMLLTVNNGIFYEFIPMNILDKVLSGEIKEIPTIGQVQPDVNYAVVISTIGGLWRYLIGDCVKFTTVYPHRIKIVGRTQLFINAFGEELMIDNADRAMARACELCNCSVKEFTVAPVFMELGEDSQTSKGYHKWAVEFDVQPENVEGFAAILDSALCNINSDYEAKRASDATMLQLKVVSLPKGTFKTWMERRGKLGGQNKVPRLYKDEAYIDDILKILE